MKNECPIIKKKGNQMSKKIENANIIIVITSIILLSIIAIITFYEYKKTNETNQIQNGNYYYDENQIINELI